MDIRSFVIGDKVGEAMGGTDPNALHGVSVNGTAAPVENKVAQITVPVNTSDLINDSTWQTETQIDNKIDARVSSTYKAGGSCSFQELPALTSANLGLVVNLNEDFTTDEDFIEGSGVDYPAGTNVVVAVFGNTYLYDVLAGFVDLSGYVQKTQKVGGVPLSGDVPVSLTGDSWISATNTGTASAVGFSVTHNDSGVTAGSKGDTTAQTPGFGGTFKAVSATVDAKGHVTALGEHNVTVPSVTATSSANGLMSKGDKAKLDALNVTASDPLEVTKSGEVYTVSLKNSGVTAGSKGDTTAQTPGFGGTFKAVSATVDGKGRLSAFAEHTVTIPSAVAVSGGANGLMTGADKAKIDAISIRDIAAAHLETYDGVNLETEFASEIAASPYNGNVWAWIKGRLTARNLTGLHIKDYIQWTSTDNKIVVSQIAGINQYLRFNDTELTAYHIDFISKDLWPEAHVWNKVGYNNGIAGNEYPYLCSDLKLWLNAEAGAVPNAATVNPATVDVDYTSTGLLARLPAALKNVIVEKRALISKRYSANGLLTDDNSWGWASLGKLWVPAEIEACGGCIWGTKGFSQAAFTQYPIFRDSRMRIKGLGNGGGRAVWWLLTPYSGNSTATVRISGYGDANSLDVSYAGIGVPVCFRIAG